MQAAPEADSEKARISRHVLTGVLLNALPTGEAIAFRELIWASAMQHLRDQPEAFSAIARMCDVLSENLWPDMNALIDEKFESNTESKEFVESLSDGDEKTP